jgi:hypothetical protein
MCWRAYLKPLDGTLTTIWSSRATIERERERVREEEREGEKMSSWKFFTSSLVSKR